MAVLYNPVTAYAVVGICGSIYIGVKLFVVDDSATIDGAALAVDTPDVDTIGYLVELEVVKVTEIVLERNTDLQRRTYVFSTHMEGRGEGG